MQLLDVRLTAIQRRNRAALVRRSHAPGDELSTGQQVVLRDEHGEYFAGTVVDVDAERYLVHLGVRLPQEYALLRLDHHPRRSTPGQEQVQEVLDLLGEARESLAASMPGQRRSR